MWRHPFIAITSRSTLAWSGSTCKAPIYLSNRSIQKLFVFSRITLWQLIGLVGRVFANGLGDLGSIPGRVIPKTQKIVLDASLLNTHHYKVRIKGKVKKSDGRSSPLPYTSV